MDLRNTYIPSDSKPLFFNIWVAFYCNYACTYCYETENKPSSFMNEQTADDLVDFMLKMYADGEHNGLWLNFHGGEPTLSSEIIRRIIDRLLLRQPDILLYTSMTTNCSSYHAELCPYISEMTVSIDGIREAHDLNRHTQSGQPTFDVSFSNALKYQKQYEDLRVRTVITPNNVKYVADGIRFLLEQGFRTIIPGIDYFASDWNNEAFEALYRQFIEIKQLREQYQSVETMIGILDEPHTRKGRCSVGCDGYSVSVSGILFPCTYVVPDANYHIGDIYRGLDQNKIRELNCINHKPVAACEGCTNYAYCTTPRCLFLNQKLTGDYYTPSAVVCAEENLKIRLHANIGKL